MSNEYFLCPQCNHCIPEMNRVIHSLHCTVSQPMHRETVEVHDLDSDEEVFMEPDLVIESENGFGWNCRVCTYKNQNEASTSCEVCGTSRFEETAPTPDTFMEQTAVYENTPTIQPDQRNSRTWKCEKCTYENSRAVDNCDMCGELRPGAEPIRERLIPAEEIYPMQRYIHDEEEDDGMNMISFGPRRITPNDLFPPAMLGAGVGAGLAYLHNQPMIQGSIQGAGLGAMGGLMYQVMREDRRRMRHLPDHMRTPFHPPDLMDQGLDDFLAPMFLPELLRMGVLPGESNRPRGLNPNTLNNLPVHEYEGTSSASSSSSSSAAATAPSSSSTTTATKNTASNVNNECSICLEHFKAGDSIRTIPCLHKFHIQCIDRWFQQSHQCPVCKYEIR